MAVSLPWVGSSIVLLSRRPTSSVLLGVGTAGDCLCGVARWPRWMWRHPVVGEPVPSRDLVREGVIARADPGIVIERPQANRDLRTVGPGPPKQTRAATPAEHLGHVTRLGVTDEQLATLQQCKSRQGDAALGERGRTR